MVIVKRDAKSSASGPSGVQRLDQQAILGTSSAKKEFLDEATTIRRYLTLGPDSFRAEIWTFLLQSKLGPLGEESKDSFA